MSRPPFWIYDDPARRLSLVRGDVRGLLEEARLLDRARWSSGGRGWVLTMADVADLIALADYRDRRYRIRQIGGPA